MKKDIKRKGFVITELIVMIFLIALMALGIVYYGKAKVTNQQTGAQLAVMKLYHTELYYYQKYGKYTSDLQELWEYHNWIPHYPVTLVDVRDRSLEKHKLPIHYIRIGDYRVDPIISEDGKNFTIKAYPIPTSDSKDLPIFTVNDKKELTGSPWFISTEK